MLLTPQDDFLTLSVLNHNLEQQVSALFEQFYSELDGSVALTSILQVLGGGTPKTSNPEYWNGGILFFTPKDVGNPYVLTTEKQISEAGVQNCNSPLYPVNTTFVTARGTVGKVSLAGMPMAMNQSCYALIGKWTDTTFLTYLIALYVVKSLKRKATGAVFDAIVTRDFDCESIKNISHEQASSFNAAVQPFFDQMLLIAKENKHLSSIRDTLLPKLMSGELDVSQVRL